MHELSCEQRNEQEATTDTRTDTKKYLAEPWTDREVDESTSASPNT